MLDVFNDNFKPDNNRKLTGIGNINYYLDKIYIDLKNVKNYYYNSVNKVSTNNKLYRILHSLSITHNDTIIDILNMIDFRTQQICKLHDIGSQYSYADLSTEEVFILKDSGDYLNTKNWEALCPLKPMFFNETNYMLTHPQNFDMTNVIYFLDLKLLAIQYLYYAKAKYRFKESYNERIFLYQYPYTNAIEGFLNLGIINTYLTNISIFEINTHPFYVNDVSKYFIKDAKILNKNLFKNKNTYDGYLLNINVLNSTALEYLQTNMPYFNRYNIVPYFIIYINIVKSIYDIMNKSSKNILLNNSRGLNIFMMYLKSTNIKELNCGEYDFLKFELLDFIKIIKG